VGGGHVPTCPLAGDATDDLRAVRRQLGRDVTARLVSAFVLSRLDYCNVVLNGLPASTLAPLRRVLHAAARLVLNDLITYQQSAISNVDEQMQALSASISVSRY